MKIQFNGLEADDNWQKHQGNLCINTRETMLILVKICSSLKIWASSHMIVSAECPYRNLRINKIILSYLILVSEYRQESDRPTGRQAFRQTCIHGDRQTGMQPYKQTGRQACMHAGRQTDR
jgi:hypothetical protein